MTVVTVYGGEYQMYLVEDLLWRSAALYLGSSIMDYFLLRQLRIVVLIPCSDKAEEVDNRFLGLGLVT